MRIHPEEVANWTYKTEIDGKTWERAWGENKAKCWLSQSKADRRCSVVKEPLHWIFQAWAPENIPQA